METFRKTGSRRAIATEVASLRWLQDAGPDGAAVADLVDSGGTWLETRFLDSASPSWEDAAEFGRRLAHTHAAGARWWGEAPPGMDPADLVTAELPTPAAAEPSWGSFGEYYAEARLRPYVAQAGSLDADDAALLHRACDAVASGRFDHPQPGLCREVARIHGDLWGGNVVWSRADGGAVGTLIDPCANGGHAETDLAELALFGSPHLEATVAGYQEVSPLADGWRERVPLHQLHMLLVHVALFGGGYVRQALSVARRLL
ncbi:fructosamine kinase family protein [Tessaracoccus massiliensis]|uniref:fructosamine kinase family protein n=1 Tax=Tessaracoccus massiliensis TaxID=1522311 RepID=UPI00058F27BB|nr:fructosamine kinase family protein [Tessaracoccus massiliensis]